MRARVNYYLGMEVSNPSPFVSLNYSSTAASSVCLKIDTLRVSSRLVFPSNRVVLPYFAARSPKG